MKKLPWLPKVIIPLVALIIGLVIGLGVGQIQIKKERQVAQDKIKEAGKKVVFMQKKMAEERNQATVSMEQQCQTDLDKLQTEKKTLGGQVGRLKGEMQKLETKVMESDEASVRTKKEIQELVRNNKDLDQELKKTLGEKQSLQAELKQTTGERQSLQADLQKTAQVLGQCRSNNAELCIIAEELIKKYRNKGLGTMLMEKEPLTQIKKVELEKLVQKYQEEIDRQKIKKNDARRQNVTE